MKKQFSITLTASFLAVLLSCNCVYSKTTPEKEYSGDLFSSYYLNPTPDKVPSNLEALLSSDDFKSGKYENNDIGFITAYQFARVAQLEPSLVQKYMDIFDKTSHEGRLFILEIFKLGGNKQVKKVLSSKLKNKKFAKEKEHIANTLKGGIPVKFDALKKPATATDLDTLWADFFITGNEQAIKRIIGVLTWPDKTRIKLQSFLKSSAPLSQKKEIAKILWDMFDIKCDVEKQTIVTNDDIDITAMLSLQGNETAPELFKKIKNALKLSHYDLVHMGTKSVADRSLSRNSKRHRKVFEICDSQIRKYSGSAKIRLLKNSVEIYVETQNTDEANRKLIQLISLNPTDARARLLFGHMHLARKDIGSARMEAKVLSNLNKQPMASDFNKYLAYVILDSLTADTAQLINKQPDYKKIAKGCISKSKKVKSYESNLIALDFANKELESKDFKDMQWAFEYEKPNKFSVEQSNLAEDFFDTWITIGKKHYFKIDRWLEEPKKMSKIWDRHKTNKFLSLGKYVQMMKSHKIKSASVYEYQDRKFALLKYDLKKFQQPQLYPTTGNVQAELSLWIDTETGLIGKALIIFKGADEKGQKVQVVHIQMFLRHNKDISIQKPKEVFTLDADDLKSITN
jgi:hypothetical protein